MLEIARGLKQLFNRWTVEYRWNPLGSNCSLVIQETIYWSRKKAENRVILLNKLNANVTGIYYVVPYEKNAKPIRREKILNITTNNSTNYTMPRQNTMIH